MNARRMSLLLMVGIAMGCHDDVQPTAPAPTERSEAVSSTLGPAFEHGRADEQIFVQVANDAPSFAGFYVERSGRLFVLVANDDDRGRARNAMIAHATGRHNGAPKQLAKQVAAGNFEIRKVKYSFRQLAAWRDLVYENVLRMDGVVYDDMDELRNRVTIGISRRQPGAQSAVVTKLKELGIPLEAVHFEPADPVSFGRADIASRNMNALGAGESTLGPYSSMGGGYKIDVGPSWCTAAFIGDFGGSAVLATASHCTNAVFAFDGGSVGAPYNGTIGTETADPAPTSSFCTFSWACVPARQSDGALFSLNGAMPAERGAVAHLGVRSSTLPPTTSFQVSPTHPWFYITATSSWHPVGWIVEKAGVTTGWTYGDISQSCTDVRYAAAGIAVRCANWVHLWSAGGDSGSPVFRLDDASDPNNMSVTLMGILSGGDSTTTYYGQHAGPNMIYTSYGSFDSELGTRNGAHLNPLTVNMLGFVYLDGYVSSGDAVLTWNAVTAPELSSPTEYRIYTWMTWRQYDQEGYPYSYLGERSLLTTTTNTTFTHSGTGYSSTSCEETDYNVVMHYQIIAWNQGIQSAGNDFCFQQ